MRFWSRFKKILKNSVVTGVPQIVVTRNLFRKAIKLIVFTGCVFGFLWQTSSFLRVYWTYPTVVDVQYQFPEEFHLPALTICSYNGIKSSLFCNKFPHLCYPNKSLTEFCAEFSFLCDQNFVPGNESYPAVSPRQLPSLSRFEYSAMGLQPQEILEMCLLYNSPRIQNCSDPHMVNVFDTKGLPSNCYSYNSLWGKTQGAKTIKTKSLLFLLLKSERTQINQFYTGTPFALQLALHSPYSLVNPFMNGFTIKPCSNYYIFPSKQINKLLPPPYASGCFDYVKVWEERSGKSPLNKRLCAEECRLNKSLEYLHCVDPFFIKYPNMAPICSARVNSTIYAACKDYCRPACFREDITVDVQEHPLQRPKGAIINEFECKSMVTISFNRMEVLKYSYAEKYESVSLFSYIGGYLGLWLGISLVAICDVIETVVLIAKWLFQKTTKHPTRVKLNKVGPIKFHTNTKDMWLL